MHPRIVWLVKNCLTFLEDPANVAISFIDAPPKLTGPQDPLGTARPPPQGWRNQRCIPNALAVAWRWSRS